MSQTTVRFNMTTFSKCIVVVFDYHGSVNISCVNSNYILDISLVSFSIALEYKTQQIYLKHERYTARQFTKCHN